jgi:hypothetical protein
MKKTPEQLQQDIAAVIDASLAQQLVESYTKMQQRYYAGDWQPSELDGGQFCEAIARALYQVDTGIVDHSHLPNDIVNQLKTRTPPSPHTLDFKDRDHFCRVLQTTYKFRSDRGVAHVSATYTANHLDATLIVATVKWMFAEFLRLAWKRDRNEVVAIIEAIIQLEHPLIYELDGKPLILSNLLSTPEEILVLLQHSMGGRLTRSELKEAINNKDQSTVNKAITRLNTEKEVGLSNEGEIVITPLGQKRVFEEILPKLSASNGQKRTR